MGLYFLYTSVKIIKIKATPPPKTKKNKQTNKHLAVPPYMAQSKDLHLAP